jgi:hypothetical protein
MTGAKVSVHSFRDLVLGEGGRPLLKHHDVCLEVGDQITGPSHPMVFQTEVRSRQRAVLEALARYFGDDL